MGESATPSFHRTDHKGLITPNNDLLLDGTEGNIQPSALNLTEKQERRKCKMGKDKLGVVTKHHI